MTLGNMNQVKKCLTLLCCFIMVNQIWAQGNKRSIKYNIKALGMNLGQFSVLQNSQGGRVSIEGVTDVEVKLFFTYQVKYIQKTIHEDGRLVSSHLQTMKNGKVNSDTWLIADTNNYILIQEGDTSLIHDDISYTGSLLYFNEPVHAKFLYKEKSGEKRGVRVIGEHKYALVNDEGKTTHEYTFKDGIMVYAKIKYPLADIHLEYCQ